MENKNLPEEIPAENKVSSESDLQPQLPVNNKPKHSKVFKALFIFFAFLGGFIIWFGIFIAPTLLEKIDPVSKLNEAHIKTCTDECKSSGDEKCVNKCLESKGYSVRVTEAKTSITPTPSASPTPTLTPIPTVIKKVTSAPKLSPTPAGPAPLIIKITLPKTGATEQTKVVTIYSHSSGQAFTRTGEGYINVYDATDGVYTISVNDVPDHKTTSANCDSNCGPGSFNYNNDSYGNSRVIGIDSKASRGVSFYWIPNSAVPNCTHGGQGPFCQ